MQYKYLSDLHLYDSYSVDWRPQYKSLDDYATVLINEWNKFTNPDDIVIVVGDVGYYCPRTIDVLSHLNGHKILVLGNHDVTWGDNVRTCGVFEGIHDSLYFNGTVVKHIPDYVYGSGYFYYIHGHHHSYDSMSMRPHLLQYASDTCRYNCAADMNNNHPCTLQELILNKELLLDRYKKQGVL